MYGETCARKDGNGAFDRRSGRISSGRAQSREAERVLSAYLDRGGNYIETAASYGDGRSERKIGKAVFHRRNEYFLATKCEKRSKSDAAAQIERSLKNLATDHLDIIFIHGVQSLPELDAALRPMGRSPRPKRRGRRERCGSSGLPVTASRTRFGRR